MRPQPICEIAAVRALERAAGDFPLMERAGAAAAGQARLLAPRTADPVAIFAGPGNNGGDAFVVARHLREWSYPVSVVFDADPSRLPPDARKAHGRYVAAGGATVTAPPALSECSLIVDGLFGIGLARPLTGTYAEWIAAINRSDCRVLALDIPTGLDADSGVAQRPAVQATHTATFIALKPGLLTGDGVDFAGRVMLHDLGIDPQRDDVECGSYVDWPFARQWLRTRRRNSHKGSFGTLGILGGAHGMTGAPLLAGRAALCAGAGKVIIGFASDPGDPRLPVDPAAPELMLRSADELFRADLTALVVGPGLSQSRHAFDLLARAISRPLPLILDADALNLIALEPALGQRLRSREPAHAVLFTPHPAEAARLLQASTSVVQNGRLAAARELASRFAASVALKGAGTVCAHPGGAWSINGTGNPGLASGGTGDVLAGIIGALVTQGYEPERALALGVCVHGAAADRLVANSGESVSVGPVGLTASDLAPAVRALLNERT
jgi:hydroxyethylthiazole kinase-like uncharacterized protein yjeF